MSTCSPEPCGPPWPAPTSPCRRFADPRCHRARWGTQIDVRALEPADPSDAVAIAAYVAKYATKTADGSPWLAHRIRSAAQIEHLELRPHVVALVRTAWMLGGRRELRGLGLRDHAHALGYAGQFSSKSVRFSTTFKALRAARVLYARGRGRGPVRLRRRVAFRRPGLRPRRGRSARPAAPRSGPGGSQPCPRSVPRSVPIAMTRENDSEKFLVGNTLWNLLSNCLRNLVWRDGAMTIPRRNQQSTGCPQSSGRPQSIVPPAAAQAREGRARPGQSWPSCRSHAGTGSPC